MDNGVGVQPLNFFRLTLLSTTDEAEISRMVAELTREQRQIQRGIHNLIISMRGALTRDEAWSLSHDERRDMLSILEERAKAATKAGAPG